MSIKRDKSLAYIVNHLSRTLTLALNDAIADLGVSPGQVPVLQCLWEQDGLTQRELYERVSIEQATMSNTLKRMERDGLIRRKPDPNDRRAARILLTAKAKKLDKPVSDAIKAVNKAALGKLKKKDKKCLMDLMGTMIDNLSATD